MNCFPDNSKGFSTLNNQKSQIFLKLAYISPQIVLIIQGTVLTFLPIFLKLAYISPQTVPIIQGTVLTFLPDSLLCLKIYKQKYLKKFVT